SSWRRTGELREKLTSVQIQSFQIADHFQQTVLELNNSILRYGVYHDTNDWRHFDVTSQALDHWIDEQRPILSTEAEKQILDQINSAYDDYMAAARQIAARILAAGQAATPLDQFAAFEGQSRRLLGLGFRLATAHRQSMDSFLDVSKKSLTYL